MPRSNKRKKEAAAAVRWHWEEAEDIEVSERLKVPNEYSSPIEAIAVPDTISSLHTNTALPDVTTSLPPADLDVRCRR
jgi:hypothetical protein